MDFSVEGGSKRKPPTLARRRLSGELLGLASGPPGCARKIEQPLLVCLEMKSSLLFSSCHYAIECSHRDYFAVSIPPNIPSSIKSHALQIALSQRELPTKYSLNDS
jgi:hypothetical protein